MPISGLPTDTGNNTVTVTPTGVHSANGLEGTDTLVVDYSSLSTNIYYRYIANGYYGFVDDFYTGIHFINFERYQITGGSGDDQLNGGDDTDILMGGAGADVITGGLGADTIDGGSGHDRWNANYGSLNTNVLLTLSATQTAQIAATGASVSGIEAVSLTLGAGADLVDTLQVTGNDDVFGGAGNDEFRSGGGIDWFNGSDGTDRIVINYSDATTAVTHRYVANGWYAVEDKAGTQRAHYINVETFDITGGSGSDTLEGAAGNDRLVGGQGNDRLVGRAGVDIVSGGAGTDTWSVDYSGLLNANVNLVNQTTNTGAVISGIEAIQYTGGAGNDVVTANAGVYNDSFFGGGGKDTFISGRGVDSVNGDVGTDKLVMDWSGIADPLHGISNSYVANGWYRFSSASGDRLDYINIDTFDLTGGAGADYLVGGSLYDRLRGSDGNDTLNSGTGDALIDGGAGNDLWVADLADEIKAVKIDATLSQTETQGSDAGLNVKRIEQLQITTGAGNDVLSTLGFALNDSINAGAGNDSVRTGLGYDGANGQEGTDLLWVDYGSLTGDVAKTYVANGWYRYADADGAASVDFINFERFNLAGGSGNDWLVGADLSDRLTGNGGNDVLDGFRGVDVIAGGDGNDTWIADYSDATTALALSVAGGAGTLTGIGTTVTGIENLQLSTGAGNDSILLADSTGSDYVWTGGGNDTINVGRGLFEQVDGGLGTDQLTINMSLATSAVRMEYYSNGWWHAISTSGDYEARFINIESFDITGSSKADRLQGFAGNDTLKGGAGRDSSLGMKAPIR